MFCCFGSSSAERERHRRNDRQTVSIIDAFVVPTTGQHTTSVPHPPPVSHASSRRHPVVDLDLGIDLEIAPHTVPPTPGPERHQRRLEEDRRQRTDSSRRPLPRPPSPVDPIVGRDSPVRRDGDNESIALSGITSASSADRGPRVVAFNRPGQSKASRDKRDKSLRTAQSNSNMSGRTLNAFEEKQMMRARERKPHGNGSDIESPKSGTTSGGRSSEKRAMLGVAHPHAHSTSSLVSSNVTRYPPSGHTRNPSSQLSHQLPQLAPSTPLVAPDWLGVASNLNTSHGSQDSSPGSGSLRPGTDGGGRRSFFDSLTRLGGASQAQQLHDIVPNVAPVVVHRVKVSEARSQAVGGPQVDLLTGGVVRDPPPSYDAG